MAAGHLRPTSCPAAGVIDELAGSVSAAGSAAAATAADQYGDDDECHDHHRDTEPDPESSAHRTLLRSSGSP